MFKPIAQKMNFRCAKSPKVRDCTGAYIGDDIVTQNNRVNDDLTAAARGVQDHDLGASGRVRSMFSSSAHTIAGVSGVTVMALVLLGLLLYFVLPRTEEPGVSTEIPGTTITTDPNYIAVVSQKASTIPQTGTLPFEPCTDLEPGLCYVVQTLGLCSTIFAQANCCHTCTVSPVCRDSDDHCFKVKIYGLCADVAMKNTCCATCKL